MTLTEFLPARIAEDEAKAREDGMWGMTGEKWKHFPEDAYNAIQSATLANARRVLAECEAKRRILDAYEDERQRMDIYNRDFPLGLLTTDGDLRARLSSNARWAGLDVAVRALVQPYADHPDFDEAWRP